MLIDSEVLRRKLIDKGLLEALGVVEEIEGVDMDYLVDEIVNGPINGGVLEKIMVDSDDVKYEIPMKIVKGKVVLRGKRVLEGKVVEEKGQKWFVVERKVEEIET